LLSSFLSRTQIRPYFFPSKLARVKAEASTPFNPTAPELAGKITSENASKLTIWRCLSIDRRGSYTVC